MGGKVLLHHPVDDQRRAEHHQLHNVPLKGLHRLLGVGGQDGEVALVVNDEGVVQVGVVLPQHLPVADDVALLAVDEVIAVDGHHGLLPLGNHRRPGVGLGGIGLVGGRAQLRRVGSLHPGQLDGGVVGAHGLHPHGQGGIHIPAHIRQIRGGVGLIGSLGQVVDGGYVLSLQDDRRIDGQLLANGKGRRRGNQQHQQRHDRCQCQDTDQGLAHEAGLLHAKHSF